MSMTFTRTSSCMFYPTISTPPPVLFPGSEVWWLAKISIWSNSLLFCSQFLAKDTQFNSQMVVSQNPAVVCPAKVYSDVTSSVWYIGCGLTSQQSMVLALSPNECGSFCTQSFFAALKLNSGTNIWLLGLPILFLSCYGKGINSLYCEEEEE